MVTAMRRPRRQMAGRLLATVLMGCTRTFGTTPRGCRDAPEFSEMKTRKNVTVDVKIDLAKCLWPLAWLVILLL